MCTEEENSTRLAYSGTNDSQAGFDRRHRPHGSAFLTAVAPIAVGPIPEPQINDACVQMQERTQECPFQTRRQTQGGATGNGPGGACFA